jgi:hypothetical protein
LQGLGRTFAMPLPLHPSVLARPWSSSHDASSPSTLLSSHVFVVAKPWLSLHNDLDVQLPCLQSPG